jgi:predicted O-methyltransferase YrrM
MKQVPMRSLSRAIGDFVRVRGRQNREELVRERERQNREELRRQAWHLALRVRAQSMLHEETLLALFLRAQEASGAVLEIGAYTGSGTVMLAKGVEASGRTAPVMTIEVGGSHDHPDRPSTNILADLHATIARYGLSQRVTVMEGWSNQFQSRVSSCLNGEKIGLLFIDADGDAERDFKIYRPMLHDDAILVVDDYFVSGGEAKLKEQITRPWIDRMVEQDVVRTIGIYPWGTWFGRLHS